jgi:succinate dehydrogenase / fumarate reductase cytochrome b subunit
MLMLSFHLSHGVGSAFQTLGLNTFKYRKIINLTGKGLAILIPLIFASIPITLYVR